MDPEVVLPSALVGIGLGLLVVGLLLRGRRREQALSDILDLPYGEQDVPVTAVTERSGALFEGTAGIVDAAERAVSRFDDRGSLGQVLERAEMPVKPGEYLIMTIGGGLGIGALLLALTGRWLYAPVGVGIAVAVATILPRARIARRRRAFEEQLPDALSLIASSLQAGHTFLRAIQMMCEEAEEPLASEFSRVVQETRLGDSVVDALDRLAARLELRDLAWVVQAIRIQQSVGGKLADLLHTLADYIRAREEIRREVRILTAEGRASAWILGALPVAILLMVSVVQPDYLSPFYEGWGPVWLLATGLSVVAGVVVILRMSKLEV